MRDIDWSVMRGSVLLLVLAILVSGGLVGGALYFAIEKEKSYLSEKGRLSSVRNRYQTIDQEKALIDDYLPPFKTLQESGIVGTEPRLEWLETLRQAAERAKLPSLRYEIGRQTPYSPGFEVQAGAFKVYGSRMKLEMGLLHEGDLPAMLAGIDRLSRGIYHLEQCRLSRGSKELTREPTATNVNAECAIRWLTFKKPETDRET